MAKDIVKEIRRATRRKFNAEEKTFERRRMYNAQTSWSVVS